MFTKNFNSLPDSLIEATKKVLNEASNEQPTINHLELSEEELNELSPDALRKYRDKVTKQIKDPNVTGQQLQKRQTGYSIATNKLLGSSGDARVRAREPENKPTTSTEPKSFGVKAGKITPKTPYNPSYSMIREPTDRSKGYGSSMPQRAAASPVTEMPEFFQNLGNFDKKAAEVIHSVTKGMQNRLSGLGLGNKKVIKNENQIEEPNEEMMPQGMSMKERTAFHMAAAAAAKAGDSHFEFGGKEYPATMSKDVASKMNEDQIEEALSPEAKERRDKLKAKVRAAKDAYKDISNQAKSPKSGMAPLKPVTPKEDPEDPEESARKHPIDRLRRIALSMKGGHFEFDNGEKHHISRDVARAIVKHYEVPSEQGGLKPYQKEKLQSDITKSHDHMMKHYNSIAGTNEDAYAPDSTPDHPANGKPMILEKKPKKLDEVPIETVKQVRMFNQSEETNDEKAPYEPDNNAPITWKKCDREAWVTDMTRAALKNKSKKEDEDVIPGAQYAKHVVVPEAVKSGHDMAPNVHIPEGKIQKLIIRNPNEYPNAIPDPKGNLQRAINKLQPPRRTGYESSDSPTSIQTRIGEESINEREMSDAEMKKREEIVMRLKDKMAGFKKRYGSRAKDVMYATATKMAMKDKSDK